MRKKNSSQVALFFPLQITVDKETLRGPGNGIITKDKITKKAPLLNGFGITKTINYYNTYNFNNSTVYTLYINKYRYAMYEYSKYCTVYTM